MSNETKGIYIHSIIKYFVKNKSLNTSDIRNRLLELHEVRLSVSYEESKSQTWQTLDYTYQRKDCLFDLKNFYTQRLANNSVVKKQWTNTDKRNSMREIVKITSVLDLLVMNRRLIKSSRKLTWLPRKMADLVPSVGKWNRWSSACF